MANIDKVEARYYRREGESFVCELCQQKCFIKQGEFGYCGTRRADEDMLVCNSYGKISSLSVDPIERMNLYHYKPHSKCLSVGSVGCNMNCQFCKNYSFAKLSIGKKRATFKSPEELLQMCRDEEMDTVTFTYNEPMVWFEYIMDFAEAAPDVHIALMTNGLVNDGPLRELCSVVEAMSIDIKSFDRKTYKKLCDWDLGDVLITVRNVYERGVHTELNYIVIPGVNDSEEEILAFCNWVRNELSVDVPVHFSRFQPDYEMRDVPLTPVELLLRCREIGMECGLNFVYVGNTLIDDADDTICPGCGEVVVKRLGFSANIISLDGGKCSKCGRDLNMLR
ncbi:MAG: AmmeMemoRadiSam system radical SAM enzyme [Candidatus Methanomethylophilaceae archaeon]|nr:AmmeMemoRadiSam system radical SAM enzyme [Candidatus Methanomethylophilaceae archaeon]MBR6871384.1 AmmeMemoRadiSam system radical SAM enzyme [Candidatus Methanomethylophilaceae archaeon]